MILYPDELIFESPLIFDTHSHYDDEAFDGIRENLLNQLFSNGVCSIIGCGVDGKSSENTLKLAEKFDNFYAAVGIHPENLESNTPLSYIEKLSKHKKCVAIGEIGLDYFYNKSNKNEQINIFEEQIILANKLSLPVIIHDREAHGDTLEILKKYKPKGVLHCFSGSKEMAEEILKIGMYIGVGGVVTFKNSKKLPEIIKMIPDKRILLETDCPYLAPEPYRGRICHSGFIAITAEKIAEIRNSSLDSILNITKSNAEKLFFKK